MSGPKQYGLTISKKQENAKKIFNVFGDDNLSDEEDGTDWVRKSLKAESEKNKVKKQTKLNIQKALKEDPTIYQYDEVYDDMERTKSLTVKKVEKKPKYIQNLLKTAERRKKEQEHRIERMVQKEREAEGNMFADKESFVTSAYRAKLEEFKQMEEEEARMNRLESIADVTKQQDMSGFYRHLFSQTVDNKEETDKAVKCEETQKDHESTKSPVKSDDDIEKDDDISKPKDKTSNDIKVKRVRQYRQRVIEEDSDSEVEQNSAEKEKVDDSKKDEDTTSLGEPEIKKQKVLEEDSKIPEVETTSKVDNTIESESCETKSSENPDKASDKEVTESQEDKTAPKKVEEKKDKSSIWKKRTVGPVFEAALQRYYTRKAMRTAAG